MPRIGINPARGQKLAFTPPRVTVAVLVHAPNEDGYFAHRLAVTRLTLESILTNSPKPFELLVFDNGSCDAMRTWLQGQYRAGNIDTLVESRDNIGKLNALWRIANLSQGSLIAYSDDDVYHLPGWLPEHLKVLEAFPNVGAVTGFYIKQRVGMSSEKTLEWAAAYEAENPGLVQRGQLIDPKWESEYMDNSGRSLERYQSEIAGLEDVVVERNGVKAWVSAHHFQVLMPKAVMLEVLGEMLEGGWSEMAMGRMVEMDDHMDAKGYLRLTTHPQTMRLLGNVIDDEVKALAARDGIETEAAMAQGFVPEKEAARESLPKRAARWLLNRLYPYVHGGGEQ
jgi:hypothetical protein